MSPFDGGIGYVAVWDMSQFPGRLSKWQRLKFWVRARLGRGTAADYLIATFYNDGRVIVAPDYVGRP